MSEMNKPDLSLAESPAVIKHLGILQDAIKRMAGNSSDCKKWAIGLVSAILVLVVKDGKTEIAWVAALPIFMFCFLDAYYLSLEQHFRDKYSDFVNSLYDGSFKVSNVYRLSGDGRIPPSFVSKLVSWSVWPFYLAMGLIVGGAMEMILNGST